MPDVFAVSTHAENWNGFSIADPNDPGMLDVVGFDTATPQLVSDFARGAL
jgi:60 kDa SS-A/Ro ribonucleoprotein